MAGETKKTKGGGQVPKEVCDQIAGLLREPFAQSSSLGDKSLDAAAQILESGGMLNDGAVDESIRESFERCKSIYCLLLMSLESNGLNPQSITRLTDWAHTKTTAEPPRKAPPLLKNKPATPSTNRKNPPPPSKETCATGTSASKEFIKIADYFLGMMDLVSCPFPRDFTERLALQNLCFALESVCQEALKASLESFWVERQSEIQKLLSMEGGFELNPELKMGLDSLAVENAAWLGDNKFPYSVLSLSLRYIYARPKCQEFEPSLAEAGTLILLFANPGPLAGWNLGNELNASGLTTSETMELAFRLFRAQRQRNQLLSISRMPNKVHRESMPEDIKRAVQLIERMIFGASRRSAAA